MLVVVALVERGVSTHGLELLGVDDWAFSLGNRAAKHEAKTSGVLCFGDSRIKLSVVPQALYEQTGRSAYNLAVAGSQPPVAYLLFRRALAAGARPEAVIIDFQPTLLAVGPRHEVMRWPMAIGIADAVRLAWWSGDVELSGIALLARLLPSVHARQGLRANVAAALAGRTDGSRWNNHLSIRHWGKNRGAQLQCSDPRLKDRGPDFFETIRRGYYAKWACEPVNADAISRFLSLAGERRIPVYWVLTPLLPAMQVVLAESGYQAEHEAFVRSWQARFPGLIVVDGRRAVQDLTGFFDHNHTSAEGALGFSVGLGEVLRQSLPSVNRATGSASERWLVMRECPPRALRGGVEDLEQSRLAILGSNATVKR
jgi:hypothetical protein